MKLRDLIPEEVSHKLENTRAKFEVQVTPPSDITKSSASDKRPTDVKVFDKYTNTNKQFQNYSQRIDIPTEFPGAFAAWFEDLGYGPGKITKSFILTKVREYLDSKGYK